MTIIHTICTGMGWMLAAMAIFFALALIPRFASRLYFRASFPRRVAVPVIFALLSLACFAGYGLYVFVVIMTIGAVQNIRRWRDERKATGNK